MKTQSRLKLINNLHPHSFFYESCLKFQLDVQVIATKHALHFFDPSLLPVKCHVDQEEWVRASPCNHAIQWIWLMYIGDVDISISTIKSCTLASGMEAKGRPCLAH